MAERLVREEGGSTIDVTQGWTNGGASGWGWLGARDQETGGWSFSPQWGEGWSWLDCGRCISQPGLASIRPGVRVLGSLYVWNVRVCMCVCILQCAPAFIGTFVSWGLCGASLCVLACVYINMATYKVDGPSYCAPCTFVLTCAYVLSV